MADKRNLEETAIQWHPAFYGAAELELRENKDDLEFQQEYNLGKEPLRVDLLVVKKRSEVQVKNEIGHIFKQYNVIEYKSPGDGLTVDDFYKTVGYACLYKGLGENMNQIPLEELTVSIFKENYPLKLFKMLRALGMKIESEIEEREQEARREGRQEGRRENTIELIKNLMESMKWTAEQAMEAMKVPAEERERCLAGL